MSKPRIRIGAWAGRPKYMCNHCRFDSLDKHTIVLHVMTEHPTEAEGAELLDPLDGVTFASVVAERAARDLGLTAMQFTGDPTGKTGYTLADVRRVAEDRSAADAAVNDEEE